MPTTADTSLGHSTGRPLPTIDAVQAVSNIAWRVTDVRDRHAVKPELEEQRHGVISVATSRDPFRALTQRYDDHLALHPGDGDKLDSVSLQYMERAKRRAEHMRDHLVLADDEDRTSYMIDGMAIIDHQFDEQAEVVAMATRRQFEDVRYESMREAARMKNLYVVGLEELTHPGSMMNLDARLDQVAEHVDQTYARAGRTMPDEVRRAQLEVRGAKCVDSLAASTVMSDREHGFEEVSELDQELARLRREQGGRGGLSQDGPSLA